MIHRSALPLAALLALFATGASAGTIANGAWTPSACGAEPAAVQLDLSNREAYNRSVEKVNTYHKDMDAYLNCMVKEANGDIQLITQTANNAQQAAQHVNEQIAKDAKAASEKFGD